MSDNPEIPSNNASQHDCTDDANLPLPQGDVADDADAPLSLDTLPIVFHMEDDIPLNDEQKCHRVALYQAALSSFLVQAGNSSMMMKEKWEMIRAACVRLHNGETRYAPKRAGYSQIAAWDKKYGIMLVGKEHVLVEHTHTTRKRKKKRRHPAAKGAAIAAKGGEDDSDEEISLPDIDMDCRRRLSHMERLFNDILHEHGNHNRGLTLSHRVAEKWCNISRDWMSIFTKTCPGCIERAPKP